MSNTSKVPQELTESFNRLLKIVPAPFRSDQFIQRTLLNYLSIRDEEFVRSSIERSLEIFLEKYPKKQLKIGTNRKTH